MCQYRKNVMKLTGFIKDLQGLLCVGGNNASKSNESQDNFASKFVLNTHIVHTHTRENNVRKHILSQRDLNQFLLNQLNIQQTGNFNVWLLVIHKYLLIIEKHKKNPPRNAMWVISGDWEWKKDNT